MRGPYLVHHGYLCLPHGVGSRILGHGNCLEFYFNEIRPNEGLRAPRQIDAPVGKKCVAEFQRRDTIGS